MTLWYWLDTGWGCGAVTVEAGRITGGAPIFRRLKGALLDRLPQTYYAVKLDSPPDQP